MADELCSKCGDPNCAAQRAAFQREPWLPNGFELGAQWYSYDGGLTWERFPNPEARLQIDGATMTVVKIDLDKGEITIKTGVG